MWILKGALLGLAVFLIGAFAFVCWRVSASSAAATGITAIQGWTVQNPLFWLGLVVCMALGCVIFRTRRGTG